MKKIAVYTVVNEIFYTLAKLKKGKKKKNLHQTIIFKYLLSI